MRILLDQANKSCWWMPWHREAMKDVYTCDKLWRAGKSFDPEISEWGNPMELILHYF